MQKYSKDKEDFIQSLSYLKNKVKNSKRDEKLESLLDDGENESIGLYKELNADYIIFEDKKQALKTLDTLTHSVNQLEYDISISKEYKTLQNADAAKSLALTKEFANLQPKSLKDSYTKFLESKKAFEKVDKTNPSKDEQQKLKALEKTLNDAKAAHQKEWDTYMQNTTKLMEKVKGENKNSIKPENFAEELSKVSNVTTQKTEYVSKTTKYSLFQNENGETKILPLNADAIKATRLAVLRQNAICNDYSEVVCQRYTWCNPPRTGIAFGEESFTGNGS